MLRSECRPYPLLLLLLIFPLGALLIIGCASTESASSATAGFIPYENIDRRSFVDAGVQVRTAHGNRVSVEVAQNDTLVWFENEQTGRFTRAFLRRGNTVYILTRESDFFRGSPSQTVAYRLFMQAWRKANRTGGTMTPSFADDQQ